MEGKSVAVGNSCLMRAVGAFENKHAISVLKYAGSTVIYLAVDGKYAGYISVADPLKPSALNALRDLKAQGIRLVMLTGDNQATAQEIARSLGIEDFKAEVLPAQKAEIVKSLQNEGRIVAMAGDGINDAPAPAHGDA